MNRARIPAEDDEDAYIFVDHRDDEISIASSVSDRLALEHAIEAIEGDEIISLTYQGTSYPVPLKFSRHDRYIMISSLANLLREHYQFFLLKPSLKSDTHGLLVAHISETDRWGKVPEHLVQLDLGYDYFHGIRIPYLGGEDTAPGFEMERQRVEDSSAAMAGFVEAVLSGKMNDALAEKMAALTAGNPHAMAEMQGMSEAEIAAEIKKSFAETMESPDMIQISQEREAALRELKALVNPAPKPWWKFW